jgi:subtilisin family serine protease
MRTPSQIALSISVGILALALGGCGGGGARPEPTPVPPVVVTPPTPTPPVPAPTPTPPPAPTPTPPPATNFNDAEYNRSNGATSSNALAAYNAGGRGQNITIGIVDSGINPDLPEFTNKIAPGSGDLVGTRGIVDTEGHGTAVSAVAAAARNGQNTLGVAFDSSILSLNTADPSNCTDKDGCKHPDSAIAAAIDRARTNGARVINLSLGGEGASAGIVAAVQRAAAAGLVIVVSAGNDAGSNPDGFATGIGSAGIGNVIIAGSVGVPINGDPANGTDLTQLSAFSNRAGSGAAQYLTALGYRVRAPDNTGSQFLWSGTSFSAPVISGAAALLASAFPNLTGAQIVTILLSSADERGGAGTDSTFGRGFLNIQRAFQPQGAMSLAGASAIPYTALTGGLGGRPMGDAAPVLPGVVVLDGFQRAYALDLSRAINQAHPEQPLEEALQPGISTASSVTGATSVSITVRRNLAGRSQLEVIRSGLSDEEASRARAIAGSAVTRLSPSTAVALGFSETGQALQQRLANQSGGAFLVAREAGARAGFAVSGNGSIGIRHDLGPVTLTVTGEHGQVAEPGLRVTDQQPAYSSAGITAERRLGSFNLALGVTRLDEESTLLGGRFAFAPAGATSLFADARIRYNIGRGWGAQAVMRNGWTSLPGGNGFVQGGKMSSDSWSFDLWRRGAFSPGDVVSLRVAQPLRVRAGGYQLNLPVSYDYADLNVGYQLATYSLAPQGRELDVEAAYAMPLFNGAGSLSFNAFLRRDPGHIEVLRDDVGGAVRLSFGF